MTHNFACATTRISVVSGNFSSATTWNPTGVPAAGDQIIIQSNHTVVVDNSISVNHVTINQGGKLTWLASKKLIVSNGFIVNGTAELIDGDIDLVQPGSPFKIGASGTVIWQPMNNTSAGATLFTNGTEDFNPTSTLSINKWYNYTNTPLGSVVTGNFGNLSLNTLVNGLLFEWNQNNQFEQHKILGKLTIDQGWVVLDKSGSISNTTIGEIFLKNVNSYLDIHSGNHPGSFTVNTSNLTNIGGTLNGIYNGDGNINLKVNGDVNNLGNIELIYNSGVQNTSNGNASMKVTGLYEQSFGDFRGIFNLSSTNTGKVNLEFGSVKITGGIFMAQYACHTGNLLSTMLVENDFLIDVTNTNSKIRGTGLNSLSGIQSNMQMQFTVLGKFTVKGNQLAEFTSSASTGNENFIVNGETRFEGCTSNFNYGSHPTQLQFNNNVVINGGIATFSKTEGALVAAIADNLILQSGQLSYKSAKGNATVTINGNYNQTGGNLFYHLNDLEGTPNSIYSTIMGDFTSVSGQLIFDNNTSSTGAHILSLMGEKFTIGGTSNINSFTNQTNPVFGTIYFDNDGITEYFENSGSPKIQNVKQVISSGCTLQIASGNMQAASMNILVKDMIKISSDATLDAGSRQIYSNGIGFYSGIKVEENGKLMTSHSEGLYNGTSNATLKANGNLTYTLDPFSIIEYYGTNNQIVTGTGVGTAQTSDQQYGVLSINKDGGNAKLNSSEVIIRKGLELEKGELYLNGYNINVENGASNGITTGNGYIKSETLASGTSGLVVWKNVAQGNHCIPFGTSATKLIPCYFNPTSGFGSDFSISTRSCSKDNRPLAPGVSNINLNTSDVSIDRVIDRWYHISAPAIKASITLSYLPNENTTNSNLATKNFSAMCWKDSKWNVIGGTGNGTITETGSVTINANNTWGPLLLISNEKLEQADLLSFDAVLNSDQVDLSWVSLPNTIVENYSIQRSTDGFNFITLFETDAQPVSSSPLNYSITDPNPVKGVTYYRLRQNNGAGSYKYSNNVRIEYQISTTTNLEVSSVGPNPFTSSIFINCNTPQEGTLQLQLSSIHGQTVLNINKPVPGGKSVVELADLDRLVTGLYVLTVSDGKSSKSFKLFKN